MQLATDARLYYCACNYLSYVFEAEALLEEQDDTSTYDAQNAEILLPLDELAGWLLEEQKYIYSLASNWNLVLNAMRDYRKPLIYNWSEKLVAAAENFTARVPALSAGSWLYYLYGAWHRLCLQTFDMLLHEPVLRETPWFTRYQSQIAQLATIIELRRRDLPSVEDVPATQQETFLSILEDLEHYANKLAEEWRGAVTWSVEQLPWKALEVPREKQLEELLDDDIPY